MAIFIVLFPLLGSVLSGFFSKFVKNPDAFSRLVSCICMISAAVLSIINFYEVVYNSHPHVMHISKWINSGNFSVNWVMKLDNLSSLMLVVVTGVSALVHVYSIGYMSGDEGFSRFMSYLSLFTFCMIILVVSDNFLQLFFGWEGVGLCSYLLIGFWYKKESANKAAIKAFVVNRVGDLAFALGIFTIFLVFDSLEFSNIFSQIEIKKHSVINFLGLKLNSINLICILLFIGCMGKSAQIGLHTWLPDAMEGPTPVSALIHAATMVTAGVFLVARCSFLFEYSLIAREIITLVGSITCLFAATIALTQNDIKKIIAYSTCSQLGYMFFACGVSAYDAGIFHLATHAFFKALLFLGAGSVIHSLAGEQDINKMGGIYNKLPFTYAMMWIGSLALSGIYPFAGYFSKDAILEAAYLSNTMFGKLAYIFGLLAAFCTAFYSFRLIIKSFHGDSNLKEDVMHHVHESPKSMSIPLIFLAFGALFAGIFGAKSLNLIGEGDFWNNVLALKTEESHKLPFLITQSGLIAGVLGSLGAFIFYSKVKNLPSIFASKFRFFYQIFFNKYYFDEIYERIFVKPSVVLSSYLWKIFDIKIIDGFGANGIASFSKNIGALINKYHTGLIYNYLFVILFAVTFIISYFVLKS